MIINSHITGSIISGDTYKVNYRHDDYDSSTDSAKLLLSGPSVLSVTGSADGSGGWNFVVSSTQTGFLQEGTYKYAFRVTNADNESYTKETGIVGVKPNPAAQTPRVIFAERMVYAIERVLEGQLTPKEAVAIGSMSVGGRSLTLLSRDELIEERARWIRILNRMRNRDIGVNSRGVNINSILGNRI